MPGPAPVRILPRPPIAAGVIGSVLVADLAVTIGTILMTGGLLSLPIVLVTRLGGYLARVQAPGAGRRAVAGFTAAGAADAGSPR